MIFDGSEAQKAVVNAILLDPHGRILLQQRDEKPDLDYSSWWTIFGGYVEEEETPEAAIRRELREELDLEVPLTFWRTFDCPVRSIPGTVRVQNHSFVGVVDQPLESLTLREGQSMRFFEPEEAAKQELAFAQHVILRDYLRDERGMAIGSNLLLLEPHDIEAGRSYPLVIFLHGSGERGDDLERVLKVSMPRFMTTGGDMPEPAFVLFPQCPTDTSWGYLIDRLEGMLAHMLDTYPIDRDRVYLTGFSMGSYGTWQWANAHPEHFAAIMPVGGTGYTNLRGRLILDVARIASHMPIWIVNSAGDTVILVTEADTVFAELVRIGAKFGYTRYPDGSHGDVSDWTYWNRKYYQWLFKQRRNNQRGDDPRGAVTT